SPEELHEELQAELNSAIDPRRDPPLRFLIVDCGPEPARARGFLVLTWFHPLMDPRGGQNLLTHLAHLDQDEDGAPCGGAISVDVRPKGEAGPTFGNWLAFHFARFSLSETADVLGLTRALRRQMADAMRDEQIDANAVAMEFLKYRPLWMMPRYLPGGSRVETFSFNCADITGFPPALETLFGRRVVNAYHAPAVLPRPGIGVFFNRCATRNNLVISWTEGAAEE